LAALSHIFESSDAMNDNHEPRREWAGRHLFVSAIITLTFIGIGCMILARLP
jgi:hypothetical protein